MISGRISSAECSTWHAVTLTITVGVVAVNLLSIILFVRNSNLRTRAMYLVINLSVADMFVGGSTTSFVVFHFLLYGCEFGDVFFIRRKLPPVFLVLSTIQAWLPLTSVTGIAAISLDRMHATFRPFRHRNIQKRAYGVTIAGVWILTAMIAIPLPLISLYVNLQQQWQLFFALFLWLSYCCLCLIVICVSYTSIALKFWCGTRPPSHGAANIQRKLTVTLFIMTIVSLLLWLPFVVHTFVLRSVLVRFSFLTHLRLTLFFSLLYFTNSLVNPIVYTIRMPEFRRALLKLFKRRQRQNAAIPLQAR
ncbi:unnamed protein product [Porites evermanni]|uniref:G-protein coupled receptors family 1 profile domain-containing protein n=1 Tax=Porites evermanni TaxID=104178 RepID=A0ABN8M5Z9_9CNID|nr:unnamed protein product [Porites evermanni]